MTWIMAEQRKRSKAATVKAPTGDSTHPSPSFHNTSTLHSINWDTQPPIIMMASTANNIAAAATTSAMEAALSSLQPIRDLSRNWDVDIASCLEEYLQELALIAPEGVTISTGQPSSTHDGNGEHNHSDNSGVPNFAHAALILQNSSNVYSRKVEYLHSLVYKALEEIFKSAHNAISSNNNGAHGRRGRSADVDIEAFYDFDPHEDFLLLDDVIPEDTSASKKKINLPSSMIGTADGGSGVVAEEASGMRRYSSANTPTDRSAIDRTQLSLGAMAVTRLDGSTVGVTMSTSPAQQRALLSILNSGDLRLVDRQCDVGADGTLLIPGSSQQSTSSLRNVHRDTNATNQTCERRSLFGENNTVVDTESGDVGESDPEYTVGNDDDEGPGFVLNEYGDNDDNSGHDGVAENHSIAMHQSKNVRFAADADNAPARSEEGKKNKKTDPWALLDPHSAGDTNLTKKTLRKGRTYRLPEGIDKPPSECVTGSSTTSMTQRNTSLLWKQHHLRPSLIVESFRIAMGKQIDPESSSISKTKHEFKGLVFGDEFLYIAKENARKRAAKRRAERKEQQKLASEGTASEPGGDNGLYYDDDDFDDNDFGGVDFVGGGDNYDDDEIDADDNGRGNAGLGSLDDVFQRASGDGNQDSNAGKTFEQLCQAHIQAFAKGAEKFALNTKLSERVSQWQSKLAPILEEEERRAAFDIHEYSKVFIEKALDESEPGSKRKIDGMTKIDTESLVGFGKVTKGCTKRDICRLFLASLSLANAGNLLIKEESFDGEYMFEIVSDELHNVMEVYLAPSCRGLTKQ